MNVSALADATRSYAHNFTSKGINYALIILRNENHHRIVESYGEEFGNKLLKKSGEVILKITEERMNFRTVISKEVAVLFFNIL